MPFDPFRGYVQGDPASLPDVERRQKLAEMLASNRVDNAGPLGALATALAGTASAYESGQAAQEAQGGYDQSQQALAEALDPSSPMDPAKLVQASGNPFMPQSQTGLMGDLIKKKLGLGTVYGNSMPYMGKDGKLHFAGQTSYGGTVDLPAPGGGDWLAPTTTVNQGDKVTQVGKFGGDAGVAPGTESLPINNSQAEFDKAWGGALGKDWAAAPENLQKEGNLVQQQTMSHQMVANKIDQAVSVIDSNPTLMTGFVGDILAAPKGTPQYDLAQQLETIKANIGFDQLQNMKDNSATGSSGLGQISNMEEQLLQAINGSLQQGQSGAQLKANLLDIKQRIAQIIEQKKQAVIQDIERYKSGPQVAPTLGSGTTTNLPANALPNISASPAAPGQKVLTYNPATGELE